MNKDANLFNSIIEFGSIPASRKARNIASMLDSLTRVFGSLDLFNERADVQPQEDEDGGQGDGGGAQAAVRVLEYAASAHVGPKIFVSQHCISTRNLRCLRRC